MNVITVLLNGKPEMIFMTMLWGARPVRLAGQT